MKKYKLNEDRFFSPDVTTRSYAREIYSRIKDLPIISPHGHVDPSLFAFNKPFPDPTELFLIPDHYIFRMLYSQGVSLECLGIPRADGSRNNVDPLEVWQIFADNYYLFAGTPSGAWLSYEFNIVFGIDKPLNSSTAKDIYEELDRKIKTPEFLPRSLYDKFNIEILSTTDAAYDNLEHHKIINQGDWKRRIIPSFRPDAVTDLNSRNWIDNLNRLENSAGVNIYSYSDFIKALKDRRNYFKSMGAAATDHGVVSPYTHELTNREAEDLFSRALKGKLIKGDAELFTAHMLMQMAAMSTEDGLVMQLHAGSLRNHNENIYDMYGPDKGADIPVQTEYTNNLYELLNKYGNNPEFTLILFTLDETSYSRELAPLAGHYPSVKLGPAWWFHDSIEGMTRYRRMTTETAGFYNTCGFNDDTRAFVSIPARHDLSRRVDSNYLAELTAKHLITIEEAFRIAEDLTYNLARKSYKL
jgi:glucuronate isomerase